MKKRSLFIVWSMLVVFSLFLSACGAEGDEYYEEGYEEEYYTEEPAAQESGSEGMPETAPGEVVFDFGFDPLQNGFSFPNYGDDIDATNLTAYEMRRLFGDDVCGRMLDGNDLALYLKRATDVPGQ